ncbi:MAG TPA: hypothetical protein VLX85_03060 [Stellaceae bacterium]|nr:hypothetical protein [Stellaceae bacterium]
MKRVIVIVAAGLALGLPAATRASDNPENDTFMAYTPAQRLTFLGLAVGCKANETFFRGLSKKPGPTMNHAYWAIRCTDGRTFQLDLAPDKQGFAQQCNALPAGDDCFKPIKE